MDKRSQTRQNPHFFGKGDAVWELLGQSEVETPCDMFSRKVMHSIRTQALKKQNWFETLMRSWGFAFASGSTAACALFAFFTESPIQAPIASIKDAPTQSIDLQVTIPARDIPAELIPVYSFEEVTTVDSELIIAAVINPSSTSDTELIDLLF